MKYRILQLVEHGDYRFEWWSWAKDRFNIRDYTEVYSGEIENEDGSITNALEKLFTIFNVRRPEDFHGHSLSVSDVVAVEVDGKEKYYYCDNMGWVDISIYCC